MPAGVARSLRHRNSVALLGGGWFARPVNLDGLFSDEELDQRVDAGLVTVRRHPTEPLLIANYTSRAANDRVWDHVTRRCRGLIWHTESHEIVARPFEKFFDLNETRQRPPDRPPLAHEKLDGSLGILYRSDGGWGVATRGSFASRQALWASAYLGAQHPGFDAPVGVTPLVEIVYRDNKIVVEHRYEELVLIAVIDSETGADIPLWEIDWWPGSVVGQEVVTSAHEGYLLATSNRYEEREGLVLTWYRPGRPSFRAKVKHPRYVHLHKILTGLTERDVWRAVVADEWRDEALPAEIGKVLGVSAQSAAAIPSLGDTVKSTPPDFQARVEETAGRLRAEHTSLVSEIDCLWPQRPLGARRLFAEWANQHRRLRSILFSRLDDKPWQLHAWSLVRPDAVTVNRTWSNEESG